MIKLRNNLKHQFEKAMQSISTFYKEENDYLFLKGELKGQLIGEKNGEEKKSHVIVENLIKELDLADEQIARIADVTIDFVSEVRLKLKNK